MKKSVTDKVIQADNAKKVNPRDLSSDQDLTIGLMNLIAIENIVSGSQIAEMVAKVREKLMSRVVLDIKLMNESYKMLGRAMALINDGMRALPDTSLAYKHFDSAYVMYSMFWGLNMGFVKIEDIYK